MNFVLSSYNPKAGVPFAPVPLPQNGQLYFPYLRFCVIDSAYCGKQSFNGLKSLSNLLIFMFQFLLIYFYSKCDNGVKSRGFFFHIFFTVLSAHYHKKSMQVQNAPAYSQKMYSYPVKIVSKALDKRAKLCYNECTKQTVGVHCKKVKVYFIQPGGVEMLAASTLSFHSISL